MAMASAHASSSETTSVRVDNPSHHIYQNLRSYSFTTDPEFKLGLAVLLGQSGTPATDEQVNRTDDFIAKAKCFYFSKKFSIQPPIDFNAYNTWLRSQPPLPYPVSSTSEDNLTSNTATNTTTSNSTIPTNAGPASNQEIKPKDISEREQEKEKEEPAYPSSFAHIVELITTGQPVPGIQQIPDTVLTGQETPSTAKRRPKPWEKETGVEGDKESENLGGNDAVSAPTDSRP